jgi:hypothetical protein
MRPLALVFSLLCAASAGAQPFPTLAHAPGPRPTAQQVLDNAIPGRPPAAAVQEEHDTKFFARDRLYRVPAPGEHPRILFSAADLPRIRAQLAATATGRLLRVDAAKRADPGAPSSWLAQTYAALAAGDANAFDALWRDPRNPQKAGPPGSLGSPVPSVLFYRALTALLDDDAARGREVATAVATYAAWQQPRIIAASKLPGAENYWLQVRAVIGDFGSLGFLYDFTHPFATPAQRETVRATIALCLQDRYGLGMDLPPHWRNWNFVGMGLYFPLLALALEREPGGEPRVIARAREVARDYILHGNSALGAGTEGVGYHSGGMAHLSVFALALANRGDLLLTLDRYRRLVDTWFLWTMQPMGRAWASNGDLGTFPPSGPLLQLNRFLFPDDPRVALVAGQAPEVTRLDGPVPELGLLQLLAPVDLGVDAKAGRVPGFPTDLPLVQFDPERGVLFTRNAWQADAAALQFHARNDTINSSHDHPDRGAFLFTALGQVWSVPSMRDTESKFHNVVTIDGVGQGYFPTPARWVEWHDSPAGTTATIDASYCYAWRWMKSSYLADDAQLAAEPWLEWVRPMRDQLLKRIPREKWERDPSPIVRAYNEGWLAGDPRMWGAEDAWVLRAPYNPVKNAFRSIAFARGAAPFLLLVDDIRKDDAERLYEWRMILPIEVDALSLRGSDLILAPNPPARRGDQNAKFSGTAQLPAGTPQLLVRVLEIARPTDAPETEPTPAVETIEFRKTDDVHQFAGRSFGLGRRLTLPSRSVEPRYRVLLFPHRAGEALPETKWESPDLLAVTARGTTTRVKFTAAADGSTRLAFVP